MCGGGCDDAFFMDFRRTLSYPRVRSCPNGPLLGIVLTMLGLAHISIYMGDFEGILCTS